MFMCMHGIMRGFTSVFACACVKRMFMCMHGIMRDFTCRSACVACACIKCKSHPIVTFQGPHFFMLPSRP